MQLDEAKEKFLQAWGQLGTNWGISRTMAQVHALLLLSDGALSTEEIMEDLSISRGNANMNIRALLDWGLVYKEFRSGERREFFYAEKDIWKVSRQIARERRKRELEPAVQILNDIMTQLDQKGAEANQFKGRVKEIHDFASKIDALLEKFIKSENSWFLKLISTFVK
ncbi:MAG: transcriptional regulator [Bacteroidia bacterium]